MESAEECGGGGVSSELIKFIGNLYFTAPVKVQCGDFAKLCVKPYEGHKKGCPNFNKRSDCPPQRKQFLDVYEDTVYVVAIEFDMKSYREMMLEKHPNWTIRQANNPLYWQGFLRKRLREYVNTCLGAVSYDYWPIFTPEAAGVDVTATCNLAGITIQWPPEERVTLVVLLAKQLKKEGLV
jgi:predicted metal-binding protein